jgi:trans-aconitate methyltransferase
MTDFNLRARSWDSDPLKVERARQVADAIRKNVHLTPGMTALEYGCGTGLLSFALQSSLSRITLADSSAGMLEVLQEKNSTSAASPQFLLPFPLFPKIVVYCRAAREWSERTREIVLRLRMMARRNYRAILLG